MTRFSALLLLLLAWQSAVFAQTITSFAPATGNVGTLVTLTGTGLNTATAVAVNGTSCLLLDQTSTSLRLLVMPGATTGPIALTGGAGATSALPFVVTRAALNTTQQGSKLVGTGAPPGGFGIGQGIAVALSADGNTLAVGGFREDNDSGATWVFTRTGTGWSQQGPKLVGTGGIGPAVYQGSAVALSADGNTLAVGAYYDNNQTGATWVFTRSGTNWSQQGGKLLGTGAARAAGQGHAVALSADGNTLAVGGDFDNGLLGATWVFARTGTTWTQQGPKLVGAGAVGMAGQGRSVALSADGNTLATGGVSDNNAAGATWVFARTGTSWSQQGPKLVGTGANGLGGAAQGTAVALSADGSTLATGGPGDNGGTGAAWVFARTGTSWSQQGPKLVGTGGAFSSLPLAGFSVALSADGATLALGKSYDNANTGAAWVFSTARNVLAQHPAAGTRVGISFFPNPVAEQFTITSGAPFGVLRFVDGVGRTLLTIPYHRGYPVNVAFLPPGCYWLRTDQGAAQPFIKR